jgi:hypothetical protein
MRPVGRGSSSIHAWRIVTPAIAVAVLVQCSPQPPPPAPPPGTSSPSAAATSPSASTPPPVVAPVTAADLGASWRPGCPVEPQQLRRVEVDYIGLDGQKRRGALIVNEDLVADVVAIFEQLLQLRYPVEKIRTVDNYPDAADELSMEDNNTSAFNCRDIPGDGWSLHAYGRAIDLNPRLNPYIDSTGAFQPNNAAPYLDRSRTDPGLLHADDPVVRVFTDRGWRWGGSWRTPIDYQHFER